MVIPPKNKVKKYTINPKVENIPQGSKAKREPTLPEIETTPGISGVGVVVRSK